MDSLDVPPKDPPPPPPKPTRPKITVTIPTPSSPRAPNTPSSIHWGQTQYYGRMPQTPASRISHNDPNFNPFVHMYHNKASEFMFKQFEGFKDFTMNTAKSGLSAGEKTAFWFYNKLKLWSKKWFTHLFLTLCLFVYSILGAMMFQALEAYKEHDICLGRRATKSFSIKELCTMALTYLAFCICTTIPYLCYLCLGLSYVLCQSLCCFVFCS